MPAWLIYAILSALAASLVGIAHLATLPRP